VKDEEGVIVTEEGDSIAEDPLVNGSARGEEEGMFVSKGFGQSVLVDIITGCKENGTGGGTNASGRLSATQGANSHRSILKAVLEPVDHYEF